MKAMLIKENTGYTVGNGAEIYNDYNNNQALSNYSTAAGYNTIAGLKGYYYKDIIFGPEILVDGVSTGTYGPCQITLTKEQGIAPSVGFTINYAIDDIISMVNDEKYINVAKITAVENNIITVDALPFSSIASTSPSFDDYSLWVVEKPADGEIYLGFYAHAEGQDTRALERSAHSEGRNTKALGQYSHAEGRNTIAYYGAHAEGWNSEALARYAHAEGRQTKAIAEASHSEGRDTKAIGVGSHAEGYNTQAIGSHSHAEGAETMAPGTNAHAEGGHTNASNEYTHAEGYGTIATHKAGHAEGWETKATNVYTHAEGNLTEASGRASHAEGYSCIASGDYAHAEGKKSVASGYVSHAEGEECQATGSYSHTEGFGTSALASYSHAEGLRTIASGEYSHVLGKCNINDVDKNGNSLNTYVVIVGNGKDANNRSNAYTLDWDGNAWFAGDVTIGKNKTKLATIDDIANLINTIVEGSYGE